VRCRAVSLVLALGLALSAPPTTAAEPEEQDQQANGWTALTEEDLARAESGNPLPVDDDQWRYSIAFPMLWMPDINGKIRGGEDIDFDIPFSDIIDQLSFGMMFELYANRGPFGLTFRSMLLNTKDEEARSGLVDTRVETDLVMGVHDLMASFRIHPELRLLTGVRYVHARLDVNLFVQAGDREVLDKTFPVSDDSQLDFLVGINYNHFFNHRWGVIVNADYAIAGDNDRDYGFDLRAIYRISDLNNLWFGWRYLNIGSDSFIDGQEWKVDMTQSGPTLGWAFTFR
jgi:hypothetical protein